MASTKGKHRTNRTGSRSRREQKSRDQTCSVSSQDEDFTDCGYSSNETLRLYEKEIRNAQKLNTGVITPQQMENKDAAARINSLRNLPDVSCTTRNLPDVSCTAPRSRPRSHGSDGSRDSRGSHDSRPGSHGSDGDCETDTNSIMTPDQLIEEANSYLQEPLDNHSIGGGTHSSRSSLTLTETEMEPDSPFHSTPAMSGNTFNSMPSSKPPPPPFRIDQNAISNRGRNRSPITNSDLSRLQDELANGHPAGYDHVNGSDLSMLHSSMPVNNPGRASSSGYETVETSNLSSASNERTLTRGSGSISPLGPQLVPYATNEILIPNSSSSSLDRRRDIMKPIESPALYEAIQLQSHPSQNSMSSRPSLYYSGGSVETTFMAPSPITHPDQNPNTGSLKHTGLITNPAILLQQGGRPLPPFNNNQATIVRQDGDSVNTYSTLNSVNTNSRTATGTFFEFPFGTPTMTNATMQSQTGTPQTQQAFTPVYSDKNMPSNTSQLKYRRITGKYVCKDKLTWKCTALILGFIILMLLGILAYFAAVQVITGSCPVHVDGSHNSSDSGNTPNKGPTTTPTRPTPVQLGAPLQIRVPAGRFTFTEMRVDRPQYVQFNLSLPKQAHFALYGSHGSVPSHTSHDFVQVYAGDPWSDHIRTRRSDNSQDVVYATSRKVDKTWGRTYKDDIRTAHGASKRAAASSGMRSGSLSSDGMIQIVKRSNEVDQGLLNFVRHLDAGVWIVGMFNDGKEAEEVQLSMDEEADWAENCPRGCSGHGVCIDGDCVCHPAYTGEDCSQDVCPVLCKGHGYYYRGQCECFVGWKGVECDIPQSQCLVANCNGHGVCREGDCLCYQGFKGASCEEVDCEDPTCSGNGICQHAQCFCYPGYTGNVCNKRVPPEPAQPTVPSGGVSLVTDGSMLTTTMDPGSVTPAWGKVPGCTSMDCSLHGVFDPSRAICMCDYGWTGRACEQESLSCSSDLDCGEHATCQLGLCQCDLNWTGTDCSEPICDLPCSFHGQCVNSSCICEAGWNGRLCGIEGCPMDCSGNGECSMISDMWQCVCSAGYQGSDCSLPKEVSCSDGRDNDGDDLIDCQDPDCCVNNHCMSASLCQTVPDPRELLLHLQDEGKPMTLSFYDQVKFLIGVGSVQKGVTLGTIDENWASVIRGKVLSLDGTPLPGVMVRISNRPEYGYTTTRPDGMFDMMVEGRGSLQLLFDREPFFRSTEAVYVHRNQFVSVDDVAMITATGDYVEHSEMVDCTGDEFPVPSIDVLPSVGGEGTTCEKTGIIVDDQSVHEQIPIPGTTLSLDYMSHLSAGRPARAVLQLVGPQVPLKLELVHIRITIEGKVREEVVIPVRNLKYSFVWNKENVYDQRVYGRTEAIVSVGYEYQGCATIVWAKRPITIEGHQWSTAALGGWQLPIQHSYNYNKASLHLGTGHSIYFIDHPHTITSIMGDGLRRDNECDQCEGPAANTRMLAPTALAYTPDGSLYIGDYNFIRRIGPDGNATNVLRLSYNPNYKYYLAASPLDGSVYLSDSQTRQIYRLRSLSGMTDMTDNLLVVAGSGEPCLPSDEYRCGDGGPAEQAKLLDPKGLAVSKDGTIYFVDGSVIRQVTRDGTISTIVGTPSVIGPSRVPRCLTTMTIDKVNLQWPSEIAINPIDDSINVLDENLVIKLTLDGQASVAAGISYNCPVAPESEPTGHNVTSRLGHKMANQEALESPSAITFSSTGDLFIAETDYNLVHRVRRVTPDGVITWFAGRDSDCNCILPECSCYEGDGSPALDAKLQVPIALATSLQNDVFIADQGNLRIRKVSPNLPEIKGGKYELVSPDKEQNLVFDTKGQHVFTIDALTELNIFTFNYTAGGRLEYIRDGSGNMFTIERNRVGIPFKMISSNVEVLRLSIDVNGYLTEVAGNNGNLIIQLGYHGSTGLLATRHDGGVLRSVFEYNQHGLLRTAKWPTGHVTKLKTSMNITHASVTMSRTGLVDVVTTKTHTAWALTQINKQEGEISTVTTYSDGFSSMSYANGLMAEIETRDHPLFEEDVQGVIAKRKVLLPEELVHRLEWRFYARRGGRNKEKILIVGRKLRVNGANVFTLEYNRYTKTERLQNVDGIPVLVITHDPNSGLPLEWLPMHGLKPTNATYDVHGRLIRWQRGLFFESYAYDNKGRMTARHHGSGTWNYHYTQGDKPTTLTVPGGNNYRLLYDAAGHLATVTMPSNVRHLVKTILSLGYTRNCYSIETYSAWLVEDFSHSGQPIQVYYMGTGRKANYLYDDSDRLSHIIFGMTLVTHKYYAESGQVQTIELIDGTFSNSLEYTYNGPLVASHIVRTRGFDGLVFAQFDYTYDPTMRVASITAEFNATTMPVWEAEYDMESGRMTRISGFTISYPDVKTQIISDGQFKLQKQYGDYALLQNIRYSILNVAVVSMDLLYDTSQRVAQRIITIMNIPETTNYIYDPAGQLEEVAVDDDRVVYRYSYSANGNLKTIQHGNNLTRLEYDERDRIMSVGNIDYQLDADGFLFQKGDESFEYNSFGQLTHAYQPRVYDVRYKYDGLGRPLWRRDHTGRQVQFFYADMTKPERVTHIYDHATHELWTLEYDLQGFLFSLKQNQRQLYISTDQSGSPIAVFNDAGFLLKFIQYDPMGNVVSDTSPDFVLYIGFHGGIYDPLTRLVHINGRDYDPFSGRWTSPSVQFYSEITKTAKTTLFNLYTFNGNNPINRDLEINYLMDMWSWLPLLGYDINGMAPTVGCGGELLPAGMKSSYMHDWRNTYKEHQPSTSIDCQARTNLQTLYSNFHTFPLPHLSSDVTTQQYRDTGFTRLPPPTGSGVLPTLEDGKVVPVILGDADDASYKLAEVLQDAVVLERLRNTENGRDVRFFVKLGEDAAQQDLTTLGIELDESTVEVELSSAVTVVGQREPGDEASLMLRINTDTTIWDVYYGLTLEEAMTMVLEDAKEIAVQQAWEKERQAILAGRRGSRNWTNAQRAAILENGRVPGYEGVYTLDPTKYPEIAFDGNSIRL